MRAGRSSLRRTVRIERSPQVSQMVALLSGIVWGVRGLSEGVFARVDSLSGDPVSLSLSQQLDSLSGDPAEEISMSRTGWFQSLRDSFGGQMYFSGVLIITAGVPGGVVYIAQVPTQ